MYNTIQLQALKSSGFEVTFVSGREYMKEAVGELGIRRADIPDKYFRPLRPSFRLLDAIRKKISDVSRLRAALRIAGTVEHDAVILLSYEVISYFFCQCRDKRVFLVNHNNVEHISNDRFKLLLTRRLYRNHSFVALSREMEGRLRELLPGRNVCFVPHGIPSLDKYEALPAPASRYVFIMSDSSCDTALLNSILDHKEEVMSLKRKGVEIIVKTREKGFTQDVTFINRRLADDEYYSLIKGALMVFLPYDKSFQCRTSGILHECFALNVPVVTSDIPAFQEYRPLVTDHELMIGNADAFYKACEAIIDGDRKAGYTGLEALAPGSYWKTILETEI